MEARGGIFLEEKEGIHQDQGPSSDNGGARPGKALMARKVETNGWLLLSEAVAGGLNPLARSQVILRVNSG